MRETYPGTSGSTQGERKETRPARKAAMGVGLAIPDYCTCRTTNRLSADVVARKLSDDYGGEPEDKVAGASATIRRMTSDGTMAVRMARSSFCPIWMLFITRSKSASA